MQMASLGLIACCMFLLSGCSSAPVKPTNILHNNYIYTKEYVTWLIKKGMDNYDITGLSIALVDDQRIVWAEGFGYANKESGVPASADTFYKVGPITGLFTATAAMQLAEQGKLDIDRPLEDYVHEFSIRKRFSDTGPITLRSLLTHHSGLPHIAKSAVCSHPEPFENLPALLKDEFAVSPPNTAYAFSPVDMTLLGIAMERCSGQDFISLMNNSLLAPLGMNSSSFETESARSLITVRSYNRGKVISFPPLRDVPAMGFISMVNDLTKFIKLIFADGKAGGRQIIRPETITEMIRRQNAGIALDLDTSVGLGWDLGERLGLLVSNAGTVAHISGRRDLHSGILVILPEHKLGVVVLTNSLDSHGLVMKAAVEALKLALEDKTGRTQPEFNPVAGRICNRRGPEIF